MPDISVIPPTRFLDDIYLPFVDPILQEEFLQGLANPLIVDSITLLFPGIPVVINLEGNIEVGGILFSTKFKLCKKPCVCGNFPLGGCIEDQPCIGNKIRVNCQCVCPPGYIETTSGNCVVPSSTLCFKVYSGNYLVRNYVASGESEDTYPNNPQNVDTLLFGPYPINESFPLNLQRVLNRLATSQDGRLLPYDYVEPTRGLDVSEPFRIGIAGFLGFPSNARWPDGTLVYAQSFMFRTIAECSLPFVPPVNPPPPPPPCDEGAIYEQNVALIADWISAVASITVLNLANDAAFVLSIKNSNEYKKLIPNCGDEFVNGFRNPLYSLSCNPPTTPPTALPYPPYPTLLGCP